MIDHDTLLQNELQKYLSGKVFPLKVTLLKTLSGQILNAL
jgi:hypothetical protein